MDESETVIDPIEMALRIEALEHAMDQLLMLLSHGPMEYSEPSSGHLMHDSHSHRIKRPLSEPERRRVYVMYHRKLQ